MPQSNSYPLGMMDADINVIRHSAKKNFFDNRSYLFCGKCGRVTDTTRKEKPEYCTNCGEPFGSVNNNTKQLYEKQIDLDDPSQSGIIQIDYDDDESFKHTIRDKIVETPDKISYIAHVLDFVKLDFSNTYRRKPKIDKVTHQNNFHFHKNKHEASFSIYNNEYTPVLNDYLTKIEAFLKDDYPAIYDMSKDASNNGESEATMLELICTYYNYPGLADIYDYNHHGDFTDFTFKIKVESKPHGKELLSVLKSAHNSKEAIYMHTGNDAFIDHWLNSSHQLINKDNINAIVFDWHHLFYHIPETEQTREVYDTISKVDHPDIGFSNKYKNIKAYNKKAWQYIEAIPNLTSFIELSILNSIRNINETNKYDQDNLSLLLLQYYTLIRYLIPGLHRLSKKDQKEITKRLIITENLTMKKVIMVIQDYVTEISNYINLNGHNHIEFHMKDVLKSNIKYETFFPLRPETDMRKIIHGIKDEMILHKDLEDSTFIYSTENAMTIYNKTERKYALINTSAYLDYQSESPTLEDYLSIFSSD